MAVRMERRDVRTLKDFYGLMAETRALRVEITARLAAGGEPEAGDAEDLEAALESLLAIEKHDGKPALEVSPGRAITVDLGYEVGELRKDIFFLRYGEDKFLVFLSTLSQGFFAEVNKVEAALQGRRFRTWITDRDGTTNNYCGRYNSSVQSVYNALWLTRYARAQAGNAVFITSAPLRDTGIVDVSVNPPGSFIYAASKGREFLDLRGVYRSYPVDAARQALLESFNDHMEAILEDPAYEPFTLIGSGFQRKFGQTTIARQDITGSIPAAESEAFLRKIGEVVAHVDPDGGAFVIEDTGLDVEVILTVEGGGGLKDFDKEEGVYFLDETLRLGMDQGPNLISGDTRSDLPLVRAGMGRSEDTWALFVTRDEKLEADVRALCPNAVFAPSPDVFVAALNQLALKA